MSPHEDTWDGGYDDAVDDGELGELMLGPYQRYSGNGDAPAHRWGSRTSIHTRRHAGDVDNMAALHGIASIADGRDCDASGLRSEADCAGEPPGEETLLGLLREHVLARLAEAFDHPATFMRCLLFDDSPWRAASGLNPDDVHAMRSLYQQDLEFEAARHGITLPSRRLDTPEPPAPQTCAACHSVIHDGRCRCS